MTAAEIAAEGKWRSASNVSVALKQLEKSGAVTHRSRMTGGAKEVQWRHADKDFDDACEVGAKDKRNVLASRSSWARGTPSRAAWASAKSA